jgi:hypothetical protein
MIKNNEESFPVKHREREIVFEVKTEHKGIWPFNIFVYRYTRTWKGYENNGLI